METPFLSQLPEVPVSWGKDGKEQAVLSTPGCLSLEAGLTVAAGSLFVVGGCPVHCRMLSSKWTYAH